MFGTIEKKIRNLFKQMWVLKTDLIFCNEIKQVTSIGIWFWVHKEHKHHFIEFYAYQYLVCDIYFK